MRSVLYATLLGTTCFAAPAHALGVSESSDAFGLANTLFLNLPGLLVNNATLSGYDGQSGTYNNVTGTYGLPNSGIILSSGNVNDYGDGPNDIDGNSTDYDFFDGGEFEGGPGDEFVEVANVEIGEFGGATPEQHALLAPITGQSQHYDVVQLDIDFQVAANINTISFFGAFGSEEYPDYVGSFVDGFGLYVNGENIAGVQPSTGGPNLPVNIDHPDMTTDIAGTQLNGILAPNGNPVLRFDVPVNPGVMNSFQIILADANDTSLDTTVYLSSFIAQGNPGDNGGPPATGNGETEFNPILPSNPQDPVTGEFVVEIPAAEPGELVWIDPPVSVGYVYDAGTAEFATITAPSLATVADLDGYIITVDGDSVTLAAGASLDFFDAFGVNPTSFTVSGIDPELGLDPDNPLAFPLGVTFASAVANLSVSITPTVIDYPDTPAVPLPAPGLLLGAAMMGIGLVKRRRKAA